MLDHQGGSAFLLLNSREIVALGLIAEGYQHEHLRDAGYDVTVAKVYGENECGIVSTRSDYWELKPQGIAVVVSNEVVRVPSNICAHASVKTTLCREGVIAVNTGIVDPGWQGPISSVVVNFGKESYTLRKDDVFLRLTFSEVSRLDTQLEPAPQLRTNYEATIKDKFETRLSDSFLDIERASEKHLEKSTAALRSKLITWIPIAALFLAGVTFVMNWGLMTVVGRSMPWDAMQVRGQSLSDAFTRQNEYLLKENQELRLRLDALKTEVEILKKAQPTRKQ